MRMYVYQNHIRLRIHHEELSSDGVNRIYEIMRVNFPNDFDSKLSGYTELDNSRCVVQLAFRGREAIIEAADVILDYFEQEKRRDLFVRFCMPDCGPEQWPGEWSHQGVNIGT